MTLQLPIGYDNFGKIRENKLDFVDKSLLIKEILDNKKTEVLVITRPRRFGKTLNLSMLHHFFAAETYGKSTQGLFAGLKITQAGDEYMQHHRKYPVIFITLKQMKDHAYDRSLQNLKNVMADLYSEHRYLLDSPQLFTEDKKKYQRILESEADESLLQDALKSLSRYLALHCEVKPWLFIDEYDTPLQSAYSHGYYDKMVDFLRGMFGAALKTNPYLHRAVVTGILRISKESLFSDLNNLEVCSVLTNKYSAYFGFTENEVEEIIQKSGLTAKAAEIRSWYNGYQFGNTVIYNPWSIVNCVNQEGTLQPYWVNTSSNDLIRELLIQSSDDFKTDFERLLKDQPIEKLINEKLVFVDLKKNELAIWSFLLMAGYLKPIAQRLTNEGVICQLQIPNLEVRGLYSGILKEWLGNGGGTEWYNKFLQHLLSGNIEAFAQDLAHLMERTVSMHDTTQDPESFYHGLFLGITASLYGNKNYEIYSNRESGYGRYDYFIFSRELMQPSLILEFKRVKKIKGEKAKTLEAKLLEAAQQALKQIDQQSYLAEARQRNCQKLVKLGLAFCGKRFKFAYSLES